MMNHEKGLNRILKNLGRRIGELRAHRGYTQAHFAELLERSLSVVQAWEKGRNFTIKTLYRISTTLGYPLKEFFKNPVSPAPRRGRPKFRAGRRKGGQGHSLA